MEYQGKLYGKVGKIYSWLMLSTQDIDEMQDRLNEAEQRERKAFESGVMVGWLNDGIREKDLETFKSVKYQEYLQSKGKETK